MARLSNYELLSRVWSECTFDDILNFGLENNYIGSESIINAATEYSDPNKEFSDEELKEIIKDADLTLVMDALNDKYATDEIVENLDESDIINSFSYDDIYVYFSSEIDDEITKAEEEGYADGYDAGLEINKHLENHVLIDGSADEKWCYLCDEFGVGHYDVNGLKNNLNKLFTSLNSSMYNKTN